MKPAAAWLLLIIGSSLKLFKSLENTLEFIKITNSGLMGSASTPPILINSLKKYIPKGCEEAALVFRPMWMEESEESWCPLALLHRYQGFYCISRYLFLISEKYIYSRVKFTFSHTITFATDYVNIRKIAAVAFNVNCIFLPELFF